MEQKNGALRLSVYLLLVMAFILLFMLMAALPQKAHAIVITTYQGYAEETITVSTSVVGFTTLLIIPSASLPAQNAHCCLETNNLRYFITKNPSASLGVPVLVGQCFDVIGTSDIQGIRFVESNTATGAGTLNCTYSR